MISFMDLFNNYHIMKVYYSQRIHKDTLLMTRNEYSLSHLLLVVIFIDNMIEFIRMSYQYYYNFN
jgi:hypothetical protein